MNIFLKTAAVFLLVPCVAFAAGSNWDTMNWDNDFWYIGLGKITGKITTSVTGQSTPIVGATVIVNGTTLTAKTGTDGSYTLDNVPEGTWTVGVSMNGFGTLQIADVQMSKDATVDLSVKDMTFACVMKGDMNDDGNIGLEEAIKALQIVSGIVE